MKVLFTFNGLPQYYNPVLNRLNKLKNTTIEVVVPAIAGNAIGAGVFQSKDNISFKVHYLKEFTTYYGKPFYKKFYKLLNDTKPDVIVTCWPYALAFVLNIRLLLKVKSMGIKLILKDIPFQVPKFNEAYTYYKNNPVLTEDGTINRKNSCPKVLSLMVLTYIRRILFNLVDAHVDYIEEAYDIFGSYGVKKEKIFIIYNSPDTDIILKARDELLTEPKILFENKFRLIHVGRLVKWKKVDMLINAVNKLKSKFPGIELIVVGDGPELDNLKQLAKDLSINERITFTGGIYDIKQLGRYFLSSAVYVLAGIGGLSINEAMCFGLPVICSECDGTEKKLVRENINGKFFIFNNLDDLTDKIESLLSQPEKLNEMGNNSISIIKNEINIETVINGYAKAFEYVEK
jgi:glycosyltransferase involved in cell wall biosynthesis